MSKIDSLESVLEQMLKDIYSAENQLLKALPKMAKAANASVLKEAFQTHLEETQNQIERLQKVGEILYIKLTGKVCKAMQGLIEEGKEVMEEESENPALIDVMLIAAAQKVEHYEIAAYGTVRTLAEEGGYTEVVELLQETLDEEGETDKKLTEICEGEILSEASAGGESDDNDDEDEEAPVSRKRKSSSSESRAK